MTTSILIFLTCAFLAVDGAPMAGPTYPKTDDGRCKVGMTFAGLDDALDGDYMTFLSSARSGLGPSPGNATNLRLAYTAELYYNHSEAGSNSYGCYEFGGWGKPGKPSKRQM